MTALQGIRQVPATTGENRAAGTGRRHWLAGLAIAAVALASAVRATGTASAQTPVPGPGLGENPGPLSGREVSLVLPPGYTLRAIRGGEPTDVTLACLEFDHSNPPPACAHLRGRYSVTLELEKAAGAATGPLSNADACVSDPAWSGWALPSVENQAQSLLVPIYACTTASGALTPIIEIPAPAEDGSVSVAISGYCLNSTRSVPGSQHTFTTGVITDDEGLLLLLAALEGKNLYDSGAHYPVQAAVWSYTEFGQLVLELLDALAPLP